MEKDLNELTATLRRLVRVFGWQEVLSTLAEIAREWSKTKALGISEALHTLSFKF